VVGSSKKARGTLDGWLNELADALGERRVEPKEIGVVLKLARDVAHGTERKLAPMSAYLAGLHVGRTTAGDGVAAEEALRRVLTAARDLLPKASDGPEEEDLPGS